MHICNVYVAIAGDKNNIGYKQGVTCAELALFQSVHGEASIIEVDNVTSQQVQHRDEFDRLLQKYPKQDPVIRGLWRDWGGRFPTDLRELRLSDRQMREDPGAGQPVQDAPADDEPEPKVKESMAEPLPEAVTTDNPFGDE